MEGVRELRESMGLSQEELAARAGVNRLTISRIEAGKNTPRGLTLKKISCVLGADPREVVKRPMVTVYLPNGAYSVMSFEDFKNLQS